MQPTPLGWHHAHLLVLSQASPGSHDLSGRQARRQEAGRQAANIGTIPFRNQKKKKAQSRDGAENAGAWSLTTLLRAILPPGGLEGEAGRTRGHCRYKRLVKVIVGQTAVTETPLNKGTALHRVCRSSLVQEVRSTRHRSVPVSLSGLLLQLLRRHLHKLLDDGVE